MKLTEKQKNKIMEMHGKGISTRQIARQVLGRSSRKSTVSDYISSNVLNNGTHQNPAKILFIDIETSPTVSYHWKRWDENIGQDQVIQESIILTFSAKFLGSDEVIYDYVNVDEMKNMDDKRVMTHIYDVLNEADIVVAHNGKRFDRKKINTRLLYHGFKPTHPYKMFDTLLSAKANFAFPSNSLDNICAYLGLKRKLKHQGFLLWRGYMEGDEKAMEKMVDYNIQDVIILEEVYLRLRSWDRMHPNVSVYSHQDRDICICCGSSEITEVDGEVWTTNVSGYQVYECAGCGKRFRGRKNILEEKPIYTNISGA